MPSANSPSDNPPFLAFASTAADIDTLKAFAVSQGWAESGIHQGDIRTAATYLKENPSPALLLVEIPSAQEASALLDALADVCAPDTKVITIGDVNEYSFYCWLMDIGIFSYLLKPLTAQMLEGAYQKSISTPQGVAKQKTPGKLIGVLGTRGGVGASTIALNLAGIVAELSKKSVGLLDVDPQEGSLALALDVEPNRGFREVLEKPDRIDSLFTQRVMSQPIKNIFMLSAEESLQESFAIHPEASSLLLSEVRDKCDVVVLDIPRHQNEFARACLKACDHVVLVTELNLLSLRDCLRLSDMMRESLKMKPPVLLANRVGLSTKHQVPIGDFEKGIGSKVEHSVAFAPDVFMPLASEIAAVKNKSHAACKPLYALAAQFVPEAKPADSKAKSSGGFFKKGA